MVEGHLASAFKKDHCLICKLNFENEEPVHVTKRGMLTIIECCENMEKMTFIRTYLNECINTNPVETVLVHSDCRRNFTYKKRPGFQNPIVANKIPSAKRLWSSRAGGIGPAAPVLDGPVFSQGRNKIPFLQKASNKQKC